MTKPSPPRPAGMSYDSMIDELRRAGHAIPKSTTSHSDLVAKISDAERARSSRDGRVVTAIMRGIGPVVREFVAAEVQRATAPLIARLAALEARPAGASLKWAGVWQSKTYPECSLVTHAGGLWLATRGTSARPGTDTSGWTLIVKKGAAP
jgi:hypothetical protein